MGARVRVSALAILILGAWGGIVPFVGPYFGFGFRSVSGTWVWSEPFGTISVAAGAAAVVGALAMFASERAVVRLGASFAVLAGAWFVIGPVFHPLWSSAPAAPAASADWMGVARRLGYHDGIGILVVVLAAYALGAIAGRPVEPEPVPTGARERVEEPEAEPELTRAG